MATENDKEDREGRFYEAMPAAMRDRYEAADLGMDWQQATSFVAGLVLLFATLAGWWTTLQSNGQILGLFAFNAWTTGLALVTGVFAMWAAFSRVSSRAIWASMAVVYAVLAIIGVFIGPDRQVLGLFANNYPTVWFEAIAAVVFAWLASTRQRSV